MRWLAISFACGWVGTVGLEAVAEACSIGSEDRVESMWPTDGATVAPDFRAIYRVFLPSGRTFVELEQPDQSRLPWNVTSVLDDELLRPGENGWFKWMLFEPVHPVLAGAPYRLLMDTSPSAVVGLTVVGTSTTPAPPTPLAPGLSVLRVAPSCDRDCRIHESCDEWSCVERWLVVVDAGAAPPPHGLWLVELDDGMPRWGADHAVFALEPGAGRVCLRLRAVATAGAFSEASPESCIDVPVAASDPCGVFDAGVGTVDAASADAHAEVPDAADAGRAAADGTTASGDSSVSEADPTAMDGCGCGVAAPRVTEAPVGVVLMGLVLVWRKRGMRMGTGNRELG